MTKNTQKTAAAMLTAKLDGIVTRSKQENAASADIAELLVRAVLDAEPKGSNAHKLAYVVPLLAKDGKPAVDADGKPKMTTVDINRATLAKYAQDKMTTPEKTMLFDAFAAMSPAAAKARKDYAALQSMSKADQQQMPQIMADAKREAASLSQGSLRRPLLFAAVVMTDASFDETTAKAAIVKGKRAFTCNRTVKAGDMNVTKEAFHLSDMNAADFQRALAGKPKETRDRSNSKKNEPKADDKPKAAPTGVASDGTITLRKAAGTKGSADRRELPAAIHAFNDLLKSAKRAANKDEREALAQMRATIDAMLADAPTDAKPVKKAS